MSKYGIEVRARTRRLDVKPNMEATISKADMEREVRDFCEENDLTFIEDLFSYDSFTIEYKTNNDKLLPEKVLEFKLDRLFNRLAKLGYYLRD